jgi:hypothetical protein
MALALLKLPLSVLALLVVGLPVLLAVVGLLLVRSRVPHPRLQPHHDVAGYIYSGLAVLYAVLLAFVVIIVWEQFNFRVTSELFVGVLRRVNQLVPQTPEKGL